MQISAHVKHILKNYESDNPGTKTSLARMLMHGKLSGTGKMVILPVDQGFEHGPGRSFSMNPEAYDPYYHYRLAIETGVNAYAAPLGFLEAGADHFAGEVPLILKINSSNSMVPQCDQAVTGSINDALRLGCTAIGFTIYPGSDESLDMMEEIRELSLEAKTCGLAVIIWAYARGNLSKEGETAINTIAYGAHMSALLGGHIIKVKLPTEFLEPDASKQIYIDNNIDISSQVSRVRHIVQCCFNGRRIVVFSGGATKDDDEVIQDAIDIKAGGGNGSIIGRNCFQRPWDDSVKLLNNMMKAYID